MCVTLSYRKTSRLTDCATPVSRFVPDDVAKLIVTYLAYVRPFAAFLQRQISGDSSQQETDCLFLLPLVDRSSRRGSRRRLNRAMRQTSEPFFKPFYFTISSYRQIAIAITKKHLKSMATTSDINSFFVSGMLSNVFALQAGHGTSTNNRIYGVEAEQPFAPLPDIIDSFRRASKMWFKFLTSTSGDDDGPTQRNACLVKEKLGDTAAEGQSAEYSRLARPTITITNAQSDGEESFGIVVLYRRWKLLICKVCRRALDGKRIGTHIEKHLHQRRLHRDEVNEVFQMLIAPVSAVHELLTKDHQSIAPFAELDIIDGWKCTACHILHISYAKAKRHRVRFHWRNSHSQRILGSVDLVPVKLQSLMAGGYLFEVKPSYRVG